MNEKITTESLSIGIAPSRKIENDEAPLPDHLMRLPGGSWKVWRCIGLRGAGFPARGVLRLSSQECAAAADRLIEADEEARRKRDHLVELLKLEQRCAEPGRQQSFRAAIRHAKKGKPPQLVHPGAEVESALEALKLSSKSRELASTDYRKIFDASMTELSKSIYEIAQTGRFQEAVLWQNRRAFHTAIEVLLRRNPGIERSSKHRQHEAMIASYLQRYCVKNDTIGFFGPVGWAKFIPEKDIITVQPGKNLLASRNVYLEGWCIDEIAYLLALDRRVQPWLLPRAMPFARLVDTTLYLPMEKPVHLDAKMARVLKECDGKRIAHDLAADLVADESIGVESIDEIYDILATLKQRSIINWDFNIPLGPNPDKVLRGMMSGFGDEGLRRLILLMLDKLESARQAIADAAGDARKLDQALKDMETFFARLTGKPFTRSPGQTYAARTLVYEDCRRDIDLRFGQDFLRELGPPLSLLLSSARWFTFQAAATFRKHFKKIYLDLARETNSLSVSAVDFWIRSKDLLYSEAHHPLEDVTAEFQKRWSQILRSDADCRRVEYSSEELRHRVLSEFNAPRPGWETARYHCPDVMIGATDEAAISRGEYYLVLGEVHLGVNTLSSNLFLAQHPSPETIVQAYESDLRELKVIPVPSRHWPTLTTRTSPRIFPPNCQLLEMADDAFTLDRTRALPLGELVIELKDNDLMARTRDGRLRFNLINGLSDVLSGMVMNCFQILPPLDHTPRIAIDHLVVCRESWRFVAPDIEFAFIKDESNRFLECRKWVRTHRIPRFAFVKTPVEQKPCYVDFEGPIFVNNFAKAIRCMTEMNSGNSRLAVTEMLPGLGHAWLPDTEGNRYTSELRIVALDSVR
ncbi:MAG: lantibiotic dehydratase family protein [Blastocatellia bacterium]|nr:lantibiotic dehydratase family protein [Blastocatellia bacterium]